MPFVQMENISHFLRACQMPPLNLPPHDVFLTVDLYESKDPAQVLQCISAFSRRANAIQPSKFPRVLGAKSKTGVVTPQMTGSSSGGYTPTTGGRAVSVASEAHSNVSGRSSPAKSPKPAISSWSRKADEGATIPAWNIHQYGYMGGASQGTQGISFGARRQITSQAPSVPSLAEKEKRRREEEERLRQQAEEEERERQREIEAQEARARAEEERRWEEETARLREKERREMEEEKKRWQEEQRRWAEEEERRAAEEKATEERLERERRSRRNTLDARLNGQFLSQYQASQAGSAAPEPAESNGSQRIRELERELELAKERERQYERERQELHARQNPNERDRSRTRPPLAPVKPSYDLASMEQERQLLRGEWQKHQQPTESDAPPKPPRPTEEPSSMTTTPPPKPPRPLPEPTSPVQSTGISSPTSPRPLPDPASYTGRSRVDRFLASNPAPVATQPSTHRPRDYSSTAEIDAENDRRVAAQQRTRAGGWASKSLLEREMERERERQREWEENQKQTREAAQQGLGDKSLGSGPGQGAWNVHQYGFMGGDSQNRGGPGLGIGGARRQIIGPRPPP